MKNSRISKLLIITGNYPSEGAPTKGTFVREFAIGCVRQGVEVCVIAPVAAHRCRDPKAFPREEVERIENSGRLKVLRPRFLSLSAWKPLRFCYRLNPTRITDKSFTNAARRALVDSNFHPDAIYGHFLYFGGAAAVRLGAERAIPSFPCVGEGVLWTVDRFGDKIARHDLNAATGLVANNSSLKELVVHRLRYPPERICAIPNGVNTSFFSPLDRERSRFRFGFEGSMVIVGAVGNFTFQKGIFRVAEAIDGIEGVVGAYAGSGPCLPDAGNTIFCSRVSHQEMPAFLSACDCFVLPTLVEGSSNATLEALACGLPVVGSDRPFNSDILNDRVSILVNPLDIDEIREAVKLLCNDSRMRSKMSYAARSQAESLDISYRVSRVLAFMGEQIAGYEDHS